MYKKLSNIIFTSTLIVLAICTVTYATTPTGQISYQGLLLDNNGQKVDGTVSIVFTIYDNNGTALWTETHSAVTVQKGLYSVILGSINPIDATLFVSSDPRYLELTVNGEVLSPRQLITGAAYALASRTGGTGTETDPIFTAWKETDYSTQSNAIWTALEEKLAKQGGVLTGPVTGAFFGAFSGNGAGLTNIQPTAISLTNVVERTGSTMSGPLTNTSIIFIKEIQFLGDSGSITNWSMIPIQPAVVSATNSLTLDVEALKGATQNLNTAIGNLTSSTQSLNNAIGNLNTATQTLNTAVGNLNAATQDLNTAVGNLNAATQNLNTSVGNLNTATQTLNTAVGNLNAATQNLNTAVGSLNTATQNLNSAVLEIQNSTNLWNNAVIVKVGSGSLTAGNVYYLDSSQNWQPACATSAVTAGGMLGIALGTAPTDGLLLIGKLSGAYTAGTPIYLGTTPGTLTTTAPSGSNQIVRIVGYGLGGGEFLFHPDRTYIEVVGE